MSPACDLLAEPFTCFNRYVLGYRIFFNEEDSAGRDGCVMSAGGRTDRSRLDHVPDGESLYCLVLGRTSRAVGAADWLDVPSTFLIAAAVSTNILAQDKAHHQGGIYVLRSAFFNHN